MTPAAPVTPDKSTSVASDKDKPSVSDKVEAPKTTPITPIAPEKDKSEPSSSSSKVEPPKIAPIPSATPDKDKSGTSDSESSKPNQAEPEKKYGDVTVEYKSKDGALIAPKSWIHRLLKWERTTIRPTNEEKPLSVQKVRNTALI